MVGLCMRGCLVLHTLRVNEIGSPRTLFIALHQLSTPVWLTWCFVTCCIVCPYVYFSIARPCVRCFDFEASFTQAIGQALGLSDPSLAEAVDYELVQPINRTNCIGEALELPSVSPMLRQLNSTRTTSVGDGPIMLTPSLNRAERCPSLDDLQGLNFLYPTCRLARQIDPICLPSLASFGLLRFAAVVLVGIISAFLVVAICSAGTAPCARAKAEPEEDWIDMDDVFAEQDALAAEPAADPAVKPAAEPASEPAAADNKPAKAPAAEGRIGLGSADRVQASADEERAKLDLYRRATPTATALA